MSALDLLALCSELEAVKAETNQLRKQVKDLNEKNSNFEINNAELRKQIDDLKKENNASKQHNESQKREQEDLKKEHATLKMMNERLQKKAFGIDSVKANEKNQKQGLFCYYTGITEERFDALFKFLSMDDIIDDIKRKISFKPEDVLFMTLCRLRQNFGLCDLAFRYGISAQAASDVFNRCLDQLYLKLCALSIWPHREVIINNMTDAFKESFPTTLIIIDGTELKTDSPWAHGTQSQLYSSYKSHTTFKGLVGCDPLGSLVFVSELFKGCISDKELTERSGFYETIKKLKEIGYVADKDGVMADKSFTIKTEIKELGLTLNIPPFASADRQMTQADLTLTDKIARHRIHVKRLISRIKDFKILSGKIPAGFFPTLNKIWTVSCYLTLFQGGVLKKM